jgi:hypothetical protein
MPRLLNPQDQRVSDRAVTAATDATQEERDLAHRRISHIAPTEADRPFYYAAFLYRRFEYEGLREPGRDEIERWAGVLREIHERYMAAIAARREADPDAVA